MIQIIEKIKSIIMWLALKETYELYHLSMTFLHIAELDLFRKIVEQF